jgi:hypothetical protein
MRGCDVAAIIDRDRAADRVGDLQTAAKAGVEALTRVWAMRGKESMGRFAHDYTKRLLPWYNYYFGVPYHFDKYDQVGVPGFAAGAMENSGLARDRSTTPLTGREIGARRPGRLSSTVAPGFAPRPRAASALRRAEAARKPPATTRIDG